jgi:branched-chain amino acid transport system substrate-binding protein
MFSQRGRAACQHLRLRFAAPVGAVVIALLAAACGSSTSSGGSAGTSAKLTGTPYVIGNIGTYSGAYASSDIGAHDAMLAWAKYTNAHGGINGHPVKLVQFDDQLNAGLATTDVKQMVEQDHVMAIVGVSSVGAEDAWAPYISTSSTAVIGDDLAGDEMGKYKNFFPEGTATTVGYYYAMPRIAYLLGKKKYGAIYCAESVACSAIATSQKAQAGPAGVTFDFSASAAAAATSYTSQCLAAKSAGVTAVALMLNAQVAGEVAAACAQQGFTPQYLQAANGFSMQETSISSLDGVAGPLPDFPWFSSANPAMKQFQDAMHTYEPQDFSSTSYGYSEASAMAWSSAEIFEAAAEKLAPGHDTSADLEAQLYKLPKGDTFGGLTPPITYKDTGGPQPADNCFFEIQLKDGKYTSLNSAKPVCEK